MPLVKHWVNFTIHTHFHQKFYQRPVQRNTRQSFIISLYFHLNRKMTKQSYKACHTLETIKNLYRCDRRKWKEIYGMTIKWKFEVKCQVYQNYAIVNKIKIEFLISFIIQFEKIPKHMWNYKDHNHVKESWKK